MSIRKIVGLALVAGTAGPASAQQMTSFFAPVVSAPAQPTPVIQQISAFEMAPPRKVRPGDIPNPLGKPVDLYTPTPQLLPDVPAPAPIPESVPPLNLPAPLSPAVTIPQPPPPPSVATRPARPAIPPEPGGVPFDGGDVPPVEVKPTPTREAAAPNPVPPPAPEERAAAPAPSVSLPPVPDPGAYPTRPAREFTAPRPVGAPGRVWADFEWLFWATSGQHLPTLATGAQNGTAPRLPGLINTPSAALLAGERRVNNEFRNGFRLDGGIWLNAARTVGIEGDFFFLENSHDAFALSSPGTEIIARPLVNALTGQPGTALVSYPGVVAGSFAGDMHSRVIGGGVNSVWNLCGSGCGRLDLLVGYRYFNLVDRVGLHEDLTALGGPLPGTTLGSLDRYTATNNFHGGVLGLSAERRIRRMFFSVRTSIAFGSNTELVDSRGLSVVTPSGGTPVVLPGGLYTQPNAAGRRSHSEFAVLPEVGLKAGVQVTDTVRVYSGYNLMYLSNVVRASDQIDSRVSPLPGLVPVPAAPAHTTDFWVQGVSLGIEMRY